MPVILDALSLNMALPVIFAYLHPGLAETFSEVYMNCGLVPPINVDAIALALTVRLTLSLPSFVTLRLSLQAGADPASVQTPGAPHDVEESFESM